MRIDGPMTLQRNMCEAMVVSVVVMVVSVVVMVVSVVAMVVSVVAMVVKMQEGALPRQAAHSQSLHDAKTENRRGRR